MPSASFAVSQNACGHDFLMVFEDKTPLQVIIFFNSFSIRKVPCCFLHSFGQNPIAMNRYYFKCFCVFVWMFLVLPVRADEQKEFVRPKFEWKTEAGTPCLIVFGPDENDSNYRKLYYLDKEGLLKVAILEEPDVPSSSRKLKSRQFYVFDAQAEVVAMKMTMYNYGDGGKIVPNERIYNNLTLVEDEQVKYKWGNLNSVLPSRKDKYGNWLTGDNYSSAPVVKKIGRAIYYYGDDTTAEAQVAAAFAEADSLVKTCEAEKWSEAERRYQERKSAHGWWWNFFLPLLVSALVSWIVCKALCLRRNISNGLIYIIAAVPIFLIGKFVVIPLGPYDKLWDVLYWILAFVGYILTVNLFLYRRCPKCASYNTEVIARTYKKTTETQKVKHGDGTEEVLSRSTDKETIEHLRCRECGHTWKATHQGWVK